MKYVKTIFSLIFMMLFSSYIFAAGSTVAINVTGKITASPCNIDTNTTSQTVELDKVYAHNLASGTGSDWRAFQLTLRNCPVGTTNATVTFRGTAASDDNYLVNTGSAKGVVLQISDSGHIISYGNGDTLTMPVDENRNVNFPLEARMYNPGGEVTGGDFRAVLQVDFTYQ